jgi:hypothetical protein
VKRPAHPIPPSAIVATILLALALPGEVVELATVTGWGFDATNLGIVVSHSYRNLFTVRPDLVAFVPGLHRHTRKRGFDLSEHK